MEDKIEQLGQILKSNDLLQEILKRAGVLQMPNWYLAAGCISQTAWNAFHGFEATHAIKDYDLVYYDATDTSYEAEDVFIRKGEKLFKDIPALVEIRNQARVHLWHERRFGFPIKPYQSVEDGIKSWPTTATCTGIRYENQKLHVYAPYGLDDLLDMIVRPNKALVTKEMYQNKVEGWAKVWPKLKIIPWDEG